MNNAYGAVLAAVIGLFYLAAPHSLHVSSGLGLNADHLSHMVFGAALLVLAGVLYATRLPALKVAKVTKFKYVKKR